VTTAAKIKKNQTQVSSGEIMASDVTLPTEPTPSSVTGTDLISVPETLPVVLRREQSRLRMRRYRLRRRNGFFIVKLELDECETEDILVTLGYLSLDSADDPEARALAVKTFVRDSMRAAAARAGYA
jgi:hypothetical protein